MSGSHFHLDSTRHVSTDPGTTETFSTSVPTKEAESSAAGAIAACHHVQQQPADDQRENVVAGSSRDAEVDDCVICISPITDRATCIPCNHGSFDFICLMSWLESHPSCPLCKALVKGVQYGWQSGGNVHTLSLQSTSLVLHRGEQRSRSSTANSTRAHCEGTCPHYRHRRLSRPIEIDPAIRRRRRVYQRGLYSLHVGSSRHTGCSEVTPEQICGSRLLQWRTKAFVERELQAFTWRSPRGVPRGHGSLRSRQKRQTLTKIVLELVTHIDLKDASGKAEEWLAKFLGADHAPLFVHELRSWLRSGFNLLTDWDKNVQYMEPVEDPISA